MERYDPSTDKWEDVAQLCSPRRCVAVGVLNGKLYAVGGSGTYNLTDVVQLMLMSSEGRNMELAPFYLFFLFWEGGGVFI